MQQLEIEFFWPLTEQTTLDLDYTPCEEWRKKQSQFNIGGSGNYLISNGHLTSTWTTVSCSQPITQFVIKPSEKYVGKWEITEQMFVYRPTKPNAVIRFFAKTLLGFKWHDEV